MSVPSQSPPLKEIGSSPGVHLFPTIYKSEEGVLINSNGNGNDRDLVTIAIRIQANHDTHHVKVAICLMRRWFFLIFIYFFFRR